MSGTGRLEIERKLWEIAAEVAAPFGIEVVEIALRGSGPRQILRVDIDRPGPRGVTIDDCKRVSDALGETLDQRDPIEVSYVLEVSSPGLDRPIRTPDDFRRNAGRRVVVTAKDPARGERSVRGTLVGADGKYVIVAAGVEGSSVEEVRIPLAEVVRACQEIDA